MALEGPVWAIDGAVHPAALARAVLNEATRRGNGVGGPNDLKVTATPVAGENVRIAPGLGVAVNRYAGVTRESYLGRGLSSTDYPIPATGSSGGATRWLVLRVDDPQFPGVQAPASIPNGPYWRPYLETTDPGWNGEKLPYPNVLLAKITQTANQATITQDDIQDLRKLANPVQFREARTFYPSATSSVPTAAYGAWPLPATQIVGLDIPEWATHLDVVAHLSGVKFTEPGGATGDTVAGVRTVFGGNAAQNGIIIEDNPGRGHYTVIGSHIIPANQRATRQVLQLQAVRTAGTGNWAADYQTSAVIDYQFSERPL